MNGQYGQQFVRHTTPSRMPCKRAAPTGLTPRRKHEDVEITKPAAFKHFTQREKKHAMAQVPSLCLKLRKISRFHDQMFII